jgi:thiamine pyrophosphate-dependent acetolactate synthase large subunit-like protein
VPVNKPPAHPVPAGQRIVQIDIDGESLGRNVPLALGLVGDARETLRLLALALAGRKLALQSDWLPRLRAERAAYLARVGALADARTTAGTSRLNEAAFARAIARLLPADAIVCHEVGRSWSGPRPSPIRTIRMTTCSAA